MKNRFYLLFLSLLLTLYVGCNDPMEHYTDLGNASTATVLDVLEDREDLSMFMGIIEKSIYKQTLSETGLYTILALNNETTQKYLQDLGYSDVASLSKEVANEIVEKHLLDFSYTSQTLSHGAETNDPLQNRRVSRFNLPVRQEKFLYEIENGEDIEEEHNVYSEYKMLTFYSEDYFLASGHKKEDLLSFYPDFNGTFGAEDIFVNGTTVAETNIRSINGWVHILNKPIEPHMNHRQILYSTDKYSIFRDHYRKSAEYLQSDYYTNLVSYGLDESGIVEELGLMDWGSLDYEFVGKIGDRATSDYELRETQTKVTTVVAPTNDALMGFFNSYYATYYTNLPEDIPDYLMDDVVNNIVFEEENYWPSQILSGEVKDAFGFNKEYKLEDIEEKIMASNGPFYGTSKFIVPKQYLTIAKPMFVDSSYRATRIMFERTRFMDAIVTEPDVASYTFLLPNNEAFLNYHEIVQDDSGINDTIPDGMTINEEGELIHVIADNVVSTGNLRQLASHHVLKGEQDLKNIQNVRFFETLGSTYIGIGKDTVYCNGVEISTPEIIAPVLFDEEPERVDNGLIYKVDNLLKIPSQNMGNLLADDEAYDWFVHYLLQAELLSNNRIQFPLGQYSTCLAPANELFTSEVRDHLDTMEIDDLAAWLGTFFISEPVFSDGQNIGLFQTLPTGENSKKYNITVSVADGKITFTDEMNKTSTTQKYSDRLTRNGVVHQVSVLFNLNL